MDSKITEDKVKKVMSIIDDIMTLPDIEKDLFFYLFTKAFYMQSMSNMCQFFISMVHKEQKNYEEESKKFLKTIKKSLDYFNKDMAEFKKDEEND